MKDVYSSTLDAGMIAGLEAWLEGMPEHVKRIARKYPPGSRVACQCGCDLDAWIGGYNADGDGSVMLSAIDPYVGYGEDDKLKQVSILTFDSMVEDAKLGIKYANQTGINQLSLLYFSSAGRENA